MRLPLLALVTVLAVVAVALYFPATAPAPNEGGGGGGGYPLFCGPANDFNTYGGPTIYIYGPLGWGWRVCSYGIAYTAPGLYTNEYGWIDGCPYPNGSSICWRWRPA